MAKRQKSKTKKKIVDGGNQRGDKFLMKQPKQPKITAQLAIVNEWGRKRLVREIRNGKAIYWIALPSVDGSEAPLIYFDQAPKRMIGFYEQQIIDRFITVMWKADAA